MKTLSMAVLAAVSFGSLVLSGCSGCAQENNTNSSTTTAAPQVTCGAGTRRVGNTCVATVQNSSQGASTLNTNGNN